MLAMVIAVSRMQRSACPIKAVTWRAMDVIWVCDKKSFGETDDGDVTMQERSTLQRGSGEREWICPFDSSGGSGLKFISRE